VNIKNDLKIVQLAGLKNNKKLARELSLWIAAGICWARGTEPWWPKWSKRHFEFVVDNNPQQTSYFCTLTSSLMATERGGQNVKRYLVKNSIKSL
jgi:hypothetical protein